MGILVLSSGTILGLILAPLYKGLGLILANILSSLISFSTLVIWVAKHYGYRPVMKSAAKLLSTVGISILVSYYCSIFASTYNLFAQALLTTIIFAITFFIVAGLVQLIDLEDYLNLKHLFKGLGAMGIPVVYILELHQKFTSRVRLN